MRRSKKLIVVAVLAAVVLVGSIGGIALANGDDSEPQVRFGQSLDRVCEIYQEKTGVAIDQEALRDAFAQAQDEVRTEAMQNRLSSMVEEGTITQEQADEFLQWQQARPDFPFGFGFRGQGGHCGFPRPPMPPNGE